MVLLKNFRNIFMIPELMRKLTFTLGVLIVYRIGTFIPVIGVNVPLLVDHMKRLDAAGGLLGYLDIFSGGALQQATLFALGVGPYVTASIAMQLLTISLPSLALLAKEGGYGRSIINQYTRYLALGLSLFYSGLYATYLENAGLVITPGWGFRALFMLSLVAGALFVMWLGEQISLRGIGSGSSMIIFAGIVARFPDYVIRTVHWVSIGNMNALVALGLFAFFVALTACVVFLEKGERKIPVQYARRVIGQRMYGGQSTYIPLKINSVGVMPVILAANVLQLPLFVASMFSQRFEFFKTLTELLNRNGALFNALEFGLIVFFTYFYSEIALNPEELADSMKKNGGFVPGIRPGRQTAEFFSYLLSRIGLAGALYLAALAIVPNIVSAAIPMPFYLGGTSLLIAVGVALDTAAQIEAYLIEHRYEGFLVSGRVKRGLAR